MRYVVRTDKAWRVTYLSALDAPQAGDLVFDALPEEPPAEHGFIHELRVVDGALVWASVAVEEPPEPEPEAPSAHTHAEIEAARAAAYRATVDPITCEIQRLRDMGGTADEIAEAEARRAEAVAAIKAQWPYPEGAE